MCVYNGKVVSKKEYFRLLDLERELNGILDGSVGFGYDYSDWPIVRPTLDGGLDISMAKWGFIPDYVRTKAQLPQYRLDRDTLNVRGENIIGSPLFWPPGDTLRTCIVLSTHFFEYQHYWKRYKKQDGTFGYKVDKKVPYRIALRDEEIMPMAGIWKPWKDQLTGEMFDTFAIATAPANPLLEVIHNSKKRMPTILTESLAHDWLFKDLTGREITQLATYQMPSEKFEAYTVSDCFRKGIDSDEEITYPGVYDLKY